MRLMGKSGLGLGSLVAVLAALRFPLAAGPELMLAALTTADRTAAVGDALQHAVGSPPPYAVLRGRRARAGC